MLDRRHRLTSSAGFTAATRRGRRAGTRTLVLHLAASGGAATAGPGPRVGLVVSRAVGNAVTRNRVKRRLRHLGRERLPAWTAAWPQGLLVVRALPAAAGASYADLGRDLDSAVLRLGREGSR